MAGFLGSVAGILLSGCSGELSAEGMDAAAADDSAPDASCIPASCDELGGGCEIQDDGCGGALECGSCDAGPGDEPFVVWMAPDGDDSLDGRKETEAIATLNRAHEILEERAPETDVEVRIHEGRYRGQSVRWTFSVPDGHVTFTRVSPDSARPIFDGCLADDDCPGGTWFRLQRSDGVDTGLVFNYLRIENYQTAISFDGNRNDLGRSNASNRIYGCYFYRIGNVFNSELAPSTAAVRLVNSDENEIANNHFVDIINLSSPNRLHAIYIAHHSRRNHILRNRFVDNSGDAVRIRDDSNDNQIHDNTFIKAGQFAGYTEWYCDHDARDDCTKADVECPSWENEFRRNELDGNFQCESLGTFEFFQSDSTTGCAPPSADAKRLRTSENSSTSLACSGI